MWGLGGYTLLQTLPSWGGGGLLLWGFLNSDLPNTPFCQSLQQSRSVLLTLFIFFLQPLNCCTSLDLSYIEFTVPKYMCVFGIVPTCRTWLHTHFPPLVCQNVLQTSLDPYSFSLSLVIFKQCCCAGTGTTGTITFCPSGIGTGNALRFRNRIWIRF